MKELAPFRDPCEIFGIHELRTRSYRKHIPTTQGLWNLIFKAIAMLGALINIPDPLRAHLHSRIKPIVLQHLSRWDSTGARMQNGKYNRPCHDLGMPGLRNVLYGPLNTDIFAEAMESKHLKLQGMQ